MSFPYSNLCICIQFFFPPSPALGWSCSPALGWICLGTDHWNESACQVGRGQVQTELLHYSPFFFIFRRFINCFLCSEPKMIGIHTLFGQRKKNCMLLPGKIIFCKQLGITVFRGQRRWSHRLFVSQEGLRLESWGPLFARSWCLVFHLPVWPSSSWKYDVRTAQRSAKSPWKNIINIFLVYFYMIYIFMMHP